MVLRSLLGLGWLAVSLVACATGSEFMGTGDAGGGDAGNGGSGGTTASGGGTTANGGSGNTGGSSTGGSMTTGTTSTTTTPEMCAESPCKLVSPQCGCDSGEMCAINSTGARECQTAGTTGVDQQCTGLYSCVPGALCLLVSSTKSVCSSYCDSDAQCGGAVCVIKLTDPQNPNTTIPNVTLCSDDCDPTNGSGCLAGLGCQLGQEQDGQMKVFAVCSGAGSGTQGASCTSNEGCAVGYGCFDTGVTECLQYCKPPNGVCSAGSSCVSFNPQIFYKGVEYGVCL